MRIIGSLRAHLSGANRSIASCLHSHARRHFRILPFAAYPDWLQLWLLGNSRRYLTEDHLRRFTGDTDLAHLHASILGSTTSRNLAARSSILGWLAVALGTQADYPQLIDRALMRPSVSPRQMRLTIQAAAAVMHVNGQFRLAEEIEIFGKERLDTRLRRAPGLRFETLYFSAIGHLALLDLLFKAVELKLVAAEDVHLIETSGRTANVPYADLWLARARELGVEVERRRATIRRWVEPDIEVWPMKTLGYALARHQYGQVSALWNERRLPPQITFNTEHLDQARRSLSVLGLGDAAWFAGVHLRSSSDPDRLLRNTSFRGFELTLSEVAAHGGVCILLGDFPGLVPPQFRDAVVDARGLSGDERDLVHNFVWSQSRIFIGNLSGGTFPPGTFGVPTLWVDVYPVAHIRPASRTDIFIPKLVTSRELGRTLTFDECLSEEHSRSQVESPRLLRAAGYSVRSCGPEEIALATGDLLQSTSFGGLPTHPQDARVDDAYRARGLSLGARVAPSFLDAWADSLF